MSCYKAIVAVASGYGYGSLGYVNWGLPYIMIIFITFADVRRCSSKYRKFQRKKPLLESLF